MSNCRRCRRWPNGCGERVELELIGAQRLAELEPLARTVDRALFSPHTSVADPLAVTQALARRVVRRGGDLRLGEPVRRAEPGWVTTAAPERIAAGHIINAAGLYADRLAHQFGVGLDYAMLPFRACTGTAPGPPGGCAGTSTGA